MSLSTHPIQILVVDDLPDNLRLLADILKQHGYTVRLAPEGELALHYAQRFIPDLILLDIRMPGINGYEVCEQLKADPQTQDIPVIFLSALDEVDDKVKAFQMGGVDYITKPFYAQEVVVRIDYQLKLKQLQQQLQVQNEQLQHEIEERQKAESQLKLALQAKSAFLANMSHELRTPLNAILGCSQLMSQDIDFPATYRNYLDMISRSGEHLLTLINDVLDLSKLEAGRMTLNLTEFDLYSLLRDLESLFHLKAINKGLTLTIDFAKTVPQYIKTDQVKLRQILINLVSNAIKFTEVGGVTVRVTHDDTSLCDPDNPDATLIPLEFTIEDTGIGISPDELEQIFEAFVQTKTSTQVQEGTGLGLSISRKFVELMGGELQVRSQLNQGSCFQFKIVIQSLNADDRQNLPQLSQAQIIRLASDQPKYRILVLEYDPNNRQLLVEMMRKIGFEVQAVSTGIEAIHYWEQWNPHLICMDVPVLMMDGLEIVRQIKSHPEGEKTVIIALSASIFEEEHSKVLEAGCDHWVSKPFQLNTLLEKIGQALGVHYVYQDQKRTIIPEPTSWLDELEYRHLPQSWVSELYEAAIRIDDKMLLSLIESLEPDCVRLGQTLRYWIDNFRYDLIIAFAKRLSSS